MPVRDPVRMMAEVLVAMPCFLTAPLYRHWHLRWEATDAEVVSAMPGDEIVPEPSFTTTRAITIAAPPEEVWPWIVQIGTGRAGFYSYDLLDNAAHPSADRILPEFQPVRRPPQGYKNCLVNSRSGSSPGASSKQPPWSGRCRGAVRWAVLVAVQPSCNPVGVGALTMRPEPDKREDLMGWSRCSPPRGARPRGTARRADTSTPGPCRPARGGRPRQAKDSRPVVGGRGRLPSPGHAQRSCTGCPSGWVERRRRRLLACASLVCG
jgi:hypothetical protein